MEKINSYKEKIELVGLTGVYIYGASLITSKGGVNIGLALMTLSALFFIKNIKMEKIEKEYKFIMLILFLTPIFDYFSAGGFESTKVTLKQMYRFLPMFVAPIFLTSKERIERFMYLITGSVFINCIYGINLYRLNSWNFSSRYKSITTYMDSAHALVGLSFIVLGLIVIELKNTKYKNLIYLLPVYILNLWCVLLGQTRGAWLALIGGLVLFSVLSIPRKIILPLVIVLGLGVGLGSKSFENNIYVKRLQSIKSNSDDSKKIRLLMWEASLNIYKENPIFGVGKDNSPKYYLEYFDKTNSYSKVSQWSIPMMKSVATAGNAHNMYFENLVNMGALFFALLGFWAYILFKSFINVLKNKKSDDKYWVGLIATTMMSAYYITGLTEGAWGEFVKRHIYLVAIILYVSNKRIGEKIGKNEK
ncbi:MAG: O-antigen ligase family protein [Cetobacterium sp.]